MAENNNKKKQSITVIGVIIALIFTGYTGGSLRKIQRDNVVNKQRAEDYDRDIICTYLEYSNYINSPKKIKELEKKLKNKEYKDEYELFDIESELRLAKSSVENSDGVIGTAKSCVEDAEEYEKEHNIEVSHKEKDLREKIKKIRFKDDSMN